MSDAPSSTKTVPIAGPATLAPTKGELIIPKKAEPENLGSDFNEPRHESRALSWRVCMLALAGVLGAPFAFAVGLRVHPAAASVLAFAVLCLLAHQVRLSR